MLSNSRKKEKSGSTSMKQKETGNKRQPVSTMQKKWLHSKSGIPVLEFPGTNKISSSRHFNRLKDLQAGNMVVQGLAFRSAAGWRICWAVRLNWKVKWIMVAGLH